MSIHLQNLPSDLESELRQRAVATGETVEDVAIEALRIGLSRSGLDDHLKAVIGQWVDDPGFEAAIADFERIDTEAWR